MALKYGWNLTVFRPGCIWGPGNSYGARLGQELGPVQLIFGGRQMIPLTYVKNCADCFVLALENPNSINETFNVVDGEDIDVWQFAGEYLKSTGKKKLRLAIPYGLSFSAVRLVHTLSKIIFKGKGKLPSILIPCRFEARFKPVSYSNAKLRQLLRWSPPLNFQDCLAQAFESVSAKG